MAEAQILIMYITFFLVVATLGAMVPVAAVGVGGGEPPGAMPTLTDDNLSLLDYLIFVFEIAVYFLFLQGLTVVGIPSAIAVIISIVFNVAMLYAVARLVRGGG